MRGSFLSGAVCGLGALACACASRASELAPTAAADPPAARARDDGVRPGAEPRTLVLPERWSETAIAAFEAELARWNPQREAGRLEPAALDSLRTALAAEPATAVRAGLLLAHSRDPAAERVLLARLEERARRPAGAFPATDVVAAAALAREPDREDPAPDALVARLEELARGRRPHPEFPVRAECALAALARGADGMIPFLLDVLREGTEAQAGKPPWNRLEIQPADLEWAQSRVAQALSRRAGVPLRYRAQATAAERAQSASELARELTRAHVGAP